MVACNKVVEFLLVFFLAVSCSNTYAEYAVPIPQFEALERGGFRVYIPALEDVNRFRFSANKNEDLPKIKNGKIYGETSTPVDGVLMIEFNEQLRVGDTINYRVQVNKGFFGYRREDLTWTIEKKDLKDEYSPLGPTCRKSSTTVNGKTSCIERTILLDEFTGSSIDTDKWTVEHMMLTYEPPTFEFNYYENSDSTRFISDGVLYLKPVLPASDNHIRRPLDLRNGCTGDTEATCYYKPAGAFYSPPVKSARITSKISFKYGVIEIKAKLPAGDWISPIIELQMKDKVSGLSSPKVVIAYARGNDRLVPTNGGGDIGSRVLYAGPVLTYEESGHSSRLKKHVDSIAFHNDFHVYKLEWVPGKMSFYIDGFLYGEVSTAQGFQEFASTAPEAPYDREYVLSLGTAVGGLIDFPDGYVSGENAKPWSDAERNYIVSFFNGKEKWSRTWNEDRPALQIDYVKVTAV
ncbi:hypothetical protein ILUMI_12795 [Ignelater luminosus]|uniref:Uncharacterized protein n=1 Tax=Ignelater luminosus TaxID=2038154 RepID=A0A8K0GC08_IGNLU|nr:hypothetical protein ILUMI_12795 [Ignelater luminosus]